MNNLHVTPIRDKNKTKLMLNLGPTLISYADLSHRTIHNKQYTYLERIEIFTGHESEGFGKKLIQRVNRTILFRDDIGILDNTIHPSLETYSIYQNNGWQCIPEIPTLYHFNAKDTSVAEIINAGLDFNRVLFV